MGWTATGTGSAQFQDEGGGLLRAGIHERHFERHYDGLGS